MGLKPFSRVPAMNTMPPQISNIRLLFSTTNPSFFLSSFKPNSITKFNNKTPIKTYPLFTCLSSRKPQRYNSRSLNPNRRISTNNTSSLKQSEKMVGEVEESKKLGVNVGFNKKRAEGKDKGRPKDLKLKVRRLNPVNTISYVQVSLFQDSVNAFFICSLDHPQRGPLPR